MQERSHGTDLTFCYASLGGAVCYRGEGKKMIVIVILVDDGRFRVMLFW